MNEIVGKQKNIFCSIDEVIDFYFPNSSKKNNKQVFVTESDNGIYQASISLAKLNKDKK